MILLVTWLACITHADPPAENAHPKLTPLPEVLKVSYKVAPPSPNPVYGDTSKAHFPCLTCECDKVERVKDLGIPYIDTSNLKGKGNNDQGGTEPHELFPFGVECGYKHSASLWKGDTFANGYLESWFAFPVDTSLWKVQHDESPTQGKIASNNLLKAGVCKEVCCWMGDNCVTWRFNLRTMDCHFASRLSMMACIPPVGNQKHYIGGFKTDRVAFDDYTLPILDPVKKPPGFTGMFETDRNEGNYEWLARWSAEKGEKEEDKAKAEREYCETYPSECVNGVPVETNAR